LGAGQVARVSFTYVALSVLCTIYSQLKLRELLDIKGEKIWIHHDGTDIGIADDLVNLRVPKSDIVLAFHEPLVRQYTGFALGKLFPKYRKYMLRFKIKYTMSLRMKRSGM